MKLKNRPVLDAIMFFTIWLMYILFGINQICGNNPYDAEQHADHNHSGVQPVVCENIGTFAIAKGCDVFQKVNGFGYIGYNI